MLDSVFVPAVSDDLPLSAEDVADLADFGNKAKRLGQLSTSIVGLALSRNEHADEYAATWTLCIRKWCMRNLMSLLATINWILRATRASHLTVLVRIKRSLICKPHRFCIPLRYLFLG